MPNLFVRLTAAADRYGEARSRARSPTTITRLQEGFRFVRPASGRSFPMQLMPSSQLCGLFLPTRPIRWWPSPGRDNHRPATARHRRLAFQHARRGPRDRGHLKPEALGKGGDFLSDIAARRHDWRLGHGFRPRSAGQRLKPASAPLTVVRLFHACFPHDFRGRERPERI